MITYRLVTGAGDELEQFDAPTDADAASYGRDAVAQPGSPGGASDFRVERRGSEGWVLVHAWMPMPPTSPH